MWIPEITGRGRPGVGGYSGLHAALLLSACLVLAAGLFAFVDLGRPHQP